MILALRVAAITVGRFAKMLAAGAFLPENGPYFLARFAEIPFIEQTSSAAARYCASFSFCRRSSFCKSPPEPAYSPSRVVQAVPADEPHTAVDDDFLHRLQAVLSADDQLAQGRDCSACQPSGRRRPDGRDGPPCRGCLHMTQAPPACYSGCVFSELLPEGFLSLSSIFSMIYTVKTPFSPLIFISPL